MNIIGIIPARMGSSRFPGKPLAKILGTPMLGHVFFRSKMCPALDEVYVATCDQEIVDYVQSIGGRAVMTKDIHERASDRCAEAVQKIEAETGRRIDIVVMIQGDEPMVFPEMIEAAIKPLIKDSSILVSNLMAPMKTKAEHEDPNEVKVVVDKNNFALYFSREPIPSGKKWSGELPMLKQVCIIPFRRDFLLDYINLEPTPLERVESVDMLRILEHGYKIKMIKTPYETFSVDTIKDLQQVEKLLAEDSIFRKYSL